jgi:hypothetical protein
MNLFKTLAMVGLVGVGMVYGENAEINLTQVDTLANALFSKRGVNEENNNFGHALERTPDNSSERIFLFVRPDQKSQIWSALKQTKYLGFSTNEPKEPYIIVVLNTGNNSFALPVAEFCVDSQHKAFLTTHDKAPDSQFVVFQASELYDLLIMLLKKYGAPVLKSASPTPQ